MPDFSAIRSWLQQESPNLEQQLIRWCDLNTHSFNLEGLSAFLDMFSADIQDLGAAIERHPLPDFQSISLQGHDEKQALGPVLCAKKRPNAPKQVLLCIHSDTVYLPSDPFQRCQRLDEHTLRGPGVADAKGGLMVLVSGLRAFEKFCDSQHVGWTLLLVPDEEVGSLGSASFTQSLAKQADIGLVFEPAYPNGALVSSRPGSLVLRLSARGKAAHAGRDFDNGINAITALSRLITTIDQQSQRFDGNINIGVIQGGTAVNQIPASAVCEINIRSLDPKVLENTPPLLQEIIDSMQKDCPAYLQLHPYCHRPPKLFDAATHAAYQVLQDCAKDMSLPLDWQPSFGVSDANFMAAAGLVTIDTLGPVGGNLHSDQEYVQLPSLCERAELLCRFLQHFSLD
ncbi:MAG: hydrolase [bacterium]